MDGLYAAADEVLGSLKEGVFESVFSGVGNLTGLAFRGKLHPEGPSPYLDDASQREGATSDGGGFGAEKAPLPGAGSGSETERYERAKAQLDEWAGIAGRGAVDRLLADADGLLGPLRVSERFRMVLAQWLGEHPGDWRGAWAVRGDR
ncbi:hypothetical protein [Saccharopolyspora spinosa]|uniref:hypothetical protein n=1 Tax=Saccharopolyspora spinosa TaxID=60894 RepID=UPI0002378A52|nr:hypothetical protein [Saccharopolyspora spinosa]